MSSLFHPKPLLGVMLFSLYSKPLLDIVIFLHLKPLLDVESLHLKSLLDVESLFSSKAIIGCYVFLTLFKAIIGYCDLSSSKAIIRCRVSFFIQSHYWVLCLSHFIQNHYWIL